MTDICEFYDYLCQGTFRPEMYPICKILDDKEEVFCSGDKVDCICEDERKRWEEA